jgi:hypothetical protein
MKLESVMDPVNHGKPLWIVYGEKYAPQLLCAKLLAYSSTHELLPVGTQGPNVCIWGFSYYKGKPGFRTIGSDAMEWLERFPDPRFYDLQGEALEHIRLLTSPVAPPTTSQPVVSSIAVTMRSKPTKLYAVRAHGESELIFVTSFWVEAHSLKARLNRVMEMFEVVEADAVVFE